MTKTKDPGLGSTFTSKISRFINEDGSYNIKRKGGLSGVKDIYKLLIDLRWWQFICLAFATYLIINILFAFLYMMIGIDQISGLNKEFHPFLSAFFFSNQTLTSVGYGQLAPIGLGANSLAAFESFVGLIIIALITGLLYGRFSKPTSKIAFSKNVIISPFQDSSALMLKMVNKRNSTLLNTSVKIMLILDSGENPDFSTKEYHRLNLQIDDIHFFPLTWTIVHEINDESPLYQLTLDEIKSRNAEVIVLVEAFDETHHQIVLERQSYGGEQWISNVKFARNFRTNSKGEIELYVNELNDLVPLEN